MNDAGRIGFVIRGAYDAASTYDFLDVVYYENASYVAKKLTVGHEPSEESEYWQLLAKTDDSAFSNTYAKKSIYDDDTISMNRAHNTTVGENSVVIGGYAGIASSNCSSSIGGNQSCAYAWKSSVIGGDRNSANGDQSSVVGGVINNASGTDSFIAGGGYNKSSGNQSSVVGGANNEARGQSSVTLGGYKLYIGNFGASAVGKYNNSGGYGEHQGTVDNQLGPAFVVGNGTGDAALSNALRVDYNGNIYGTKAFQSSGADYAEYIRPWQDGNPYNEDRVGYFVTIKEGLLHKASAGDYIAGITSGNPSVVGNADEDYYWRYERDIFNRIVLEDVPEKVQQTDEEGNPVFDEETHEPVMIETGRIIPKARMKLADGYDPSLQEGYIPRADRPEWDCVGMVGVLPVRDDGTCVPGQFCRCADGGIATLAEKRDFDTYYVLERISENVVGVILK